MRDIERMAVSRMCNWKVKTSHSANGFTYRWKKG